MIQQTKTKKQTNCHSLKSLKVLHHGRFVVLGGALKFARATYFFKRDLKLSNTMIVVKGICYYLIEKEEVGMGVELNLGLNKLVA